MPTYLPNFFSTPLLETKIIFCLALSCFQKQECNKLFHVLNICFFKPKEIPFDIFEKKLFANHISLQII